MDTRGWNERYRSRERRAEDIDAAPTPLVMEIGRQLTPGRGLDLAAGAGRNALWLAENGWRVTAIDGAPAALELLSGRARDAGLFIEARLADLTAPEFSIESVAFDLVLICYYLQRDLFERAKLAVKPGGVFLAIVHTTEGDEQPTASRLRPGELASYFTGWETLHSFEGKPADPAHRRAVAEIVARRPHV